MWQALRRLIAANPMGIFLWGLITKWYLIIAVASLIVLYYVVKGLDQIGFIDYFTRTTIEVLDTTKAVAQNCIPKLGKKGQNSNWDNLVSFWDCLGDPGYYEIREGTGEKELQEHMEDLILLQPTVPEPGNPYDNNAN